MTDKQIKLKSIQHYKLMIKWAENQDPAEMVDIEKMFSELGVCWESDYCVYCEYSYDCRQCKLYSIYGCCGGLWSNLSCSKTWSEWIVNAKNVLAYIKENG